MKKLKIYFFSILFLIALPLLVFAIPTTTFKQLSNNNLSTNQSAYMNGFCYGQMNGSGTGFIGFNNASLFYATSLTTAFTNTSAGLSTLGMFTSGTLAPSLPNGTCMDVQYIPRMAIGPNGVDGYARIGFQAPLAGTNSCGDAASGSACGGSIGSNDGNLSFFNNDVVTETGARWTRSLQVNMTICKNATGAEVYYWNNDTYRAVVTDKPVSQINFSVRLELAASNINLTWACAWNATTGAPGVPSVASADTTAPIVNTTFNNTNPLVNNVINFSGNITDETGLLSANITYNLSGSITKINFSLSGTSAQINTTVQLSCVETCVINFTLYATDTSNNVKQNSTLIIVSDRTLPVVNTTFNNTNPKINENVNISSNITDGVGLSFCQFVDNGSLSNGAKQYINQSLTGTNSQCSQNYTIKLPRGNVINFSVIANDSSNNIRTNTTIITIIDTPITFTSFSNTTDLTFRTNQTINWSCSDPDGAILSNAYFESINPPTVQITTNTVDFNITTNMTNQTKYFLNITCSSNGVTAYSTIFNITLDYSVPSCSSGIPTNGSFYNSDTNLSTPCTDNIQLFEINSTLRALGVDAQIFNSTNITNLTVASYIFNTTLKVREIGDMQLNFTQWLGDTKNDHAPMLPNVKVGKDKSDKTKSNDNIYIFNETTTGLQVNFTVLINKSPPKDNQNLNISFNLINNDYFKLSLSYDTSEENQSTFINFTSNMPIFPINDLFSTHLLFGSGKNILSYDSDDAQQNFTTYLTNSGNSFLVQFIPKSPIPKNSRLVIDPKVDNLNIQEYSRIIEIDTGLPQFFNLNVSNNKMVGNKSFIPSSILNFSINVSDKNNNSVLFYINNLKNISIGYQSNITSNGTIIFSDGNYTALIEINDSAGNKINGSYLLGFVVDTTPPTFISAFNRTADGSNSSSITPSTSVNLSIFGVDDLYLASGNFSENCTLSTRAWQNHSITINGNQTPYYQILDNTNFTAGQICGWKFYFYDLAGNLLDPIYTFPINAISSSGRSSSSGGGGGGGGVTSSSIALLDPFGTSAAEGCKDGEQEYQGRCYPCDKSKGYLVFNPDDRSIICKECQEGFELVNQSCLPLPPNPVPTSRINQQIDFWAGKISHFFNTDNLLVGYFVILVSVTTTLNYLWIWSKKK